MASLAIRNLSKSFGRNTVMNDVSFEVSEGEFCILLGPSGCGKTTVLRLIAGLEHQDAGDILINGREVSGLTPRERDVAMVFQSYALYPHLNVSENMAFSLKLQKRPKEEIRQKVMEAARLLSLEHLLTRKPRELSGGQRQRVAIGRAIVRNPKLFLFDEPLSNLDAKLRASMRIELAKLHQALGATMVYVTHDQIEAMTLGEKIILFDKGVIQQIGTPEEVYESPSNLFVATFVGSPGINLLGGNVVLQESKTFFRSGELMLDIGKKAELQNYIGKEITLGIRPESLTPGEGPLSGVVEIIEHIGPESILYLKKGDTRLIAKAPPGYHAEAGRRVSLTLSPRGMHFFHEGQRIELNRR